MASDVFMYLYKSGSKIQGGSTDAMFPESIELRSFSMDAEGTVVSDPAEIDKLRDRLLTSRDKPFATETDEAEEPLDSFTIEIKKDFDIASTELFNNYAQAASRKPIHFDKAEVFCRIGGPTANPDAQAVQVCVLIYEFRQLYVFDYSLDTSEKSSIPSEKCQLYFDKYRITYRQQLASGKLDKALALGWDFDQSKPY
jgi:type VI protein secretion system component Hcp